MMSHRHRMLSASQDEVRRLMGQRVSEVTPSRRDFAQYVATQKTDLAVVARLVSGGRAQLIEHARACDDAEVAALAVATAPGGLSVEDMAAIAAATTAPILRDVLTIDPCQLYEARLHGADAVVLPVAEISTDLLRELVLVASSLHMASIVDVQTVEEVETAAPLPHVIIGLSCTTSADSLDLGRTLQLAQRVSRARTVIVLPPVSSAADSDALRGIVDAVVAEEVLQVSDVASVVRQLASGGAS